MAAFATRVMTTTTSSLCPQTGIFPRPAFDELCSPDDIVDDCNSAPSTYGSIVEIG